MFLELCQSYLELFDLQLVLISLGTKMGRDEDVVIDAKESIGVRTV